ncbi:DUF4236 domain-containing protein [Subtercola vilae]|uniref:DUF4236 domain-containing protein n=1 Tax=Subtercola vilae TaxID=2056433 RepID=A0A4T2BV34_9MICO|nr:DUF4236 domain-containing protein [Subtercola vilae]TIH34989.1 DUF4236 domain-containing protein [Subtercola vilae]
MGLIFRKTVKTGANTHLNISKSGVSETAKVGRVTLNTRGQGRIRIMKGLSFRFKL